MEVLQKLIFITLASSLLARSLEPSARSIPEATSVVQASGKFANHMYKELSKEGENVLISPASAHACLSMLYQGASGPIKEDLEKVLGVTASEAAEGYHFIMHSINSPKTANTTIANKIYVDETLILKQSFADVVRNKFLSEVESINFKDYETAADIINEWVKQKTQNKIQKLFGKKDLENVVLALVNTIYFKDSWAYQFHDIQTEEEPFYLTDGSTVNVATMHQSNHHPYKEDKTLDAKLVRLPYMDSHYSMVIILPNKKDGIAELEQKLQDVDISQITEGFAGTKLYISLPKFKFSTEMDLMDTLSNMGLEKIFQPSHDLDGLVDTPYEVYVGKAIQKVFIQVDEKGSEAAAATGVGAQLGASPFAPVEEPVDFRVDHPFVFLLTHQPGLGVSHENILFYGKVEKPVFQE